MKVDVKLTAVFEEAEEGGYTAYLEEIPGINTQGENLEEAKINLEEAFKLVVETRRSLQKEHKKKGNIIKEVFQLA